jgi:hypothetical protein
MTLEDVGPDIWRHCAALKVAGLLDAGLVTEEEFAAKKAEWLAKV